MRHAFILNKLKRPDIPCLQAAFRSNGGGISAARYSPTCIQRLADLGLLMPKPNQFRGNPQQGAYLMVLTPDGKQFIQEHSEKA